MNSLTHPSHALPDPIRKKLAINTDCWLWTGAVNSKGYPSTGNGRGSSMLAHRAAYEALRGPIPDGMTIDHLCRVKLCLNPDHLEVVTRAENSRRGNFDIDTHCPRGHELTPENVYERIKPHGQLRRECRMCRREKAAQRAAALDVESARIHNAVSGAEFPVSGDDLACKGAA